MAENLHCSPYNHVKYGEKDGTCYSQDDLKKIAKEYNKTASKKIPIDLPKKVLHTKLKEGFKNICTHESCWIGRKTTNLRELKTSFRPEKPQEWYDNRGTWLNTYDILLVMNQYQILYKDFKFVGVYPIDFTKSNSTGRCIGDSFKERGNSSQYTLCNFDVKALMKEKKKRFAMVLNLDEHDEPGSHWVSIYCNLNPKKENYGIYYYDSVANEPETEILEFMKFVKKQVNDPKFKLKYNTTQKQFKNNECGMFSLIFLTQCLKNVPFNFICKHMKTDDEINKLRDILYSPSK